MMRYPTGWFSLSWWLHAVARVALAGLIWWLLTEGSAGAWSVGGPVVMVAALASLYWSGTVPYRLSPLGALRFGAVFLYASLIGGMDVARRALMPSLPLNPTIAQWQTTLPTGAPRWLLATVLSLVPGSLTVELDGDRVTMHWLDADAASERTFRRIERHVAHVFAVLPGGTP